jgi:hypothetical protein
MNFKMQLFIYDYVMLCQNCVADSFSLYAYSWTLCVIYGDSSYVKDYEKLLIIIQI